MRSKGIGESVSIVTGRAVCCLQVISSDRASMRMLAIAHDCPLCAHLLDWTLAIPVGTAFSIRHAGCSVLRTITNQRSGLGGGKGSDRMATGTVKWFNNQKRFGFIVPDDGGNDIFVHISAVERAGLSSLAEGQKISYEIKVDPKHAKGCAEKLRV